ncbi:MAG: hypothetical protein FWC26_06550 [Fibromonadales bacterium]|nr:hypothetical protein [Fibromonadales bacterium]
MISPEIAQVAINEIRSQPIETSCGSITIADIIASIPFGTRRKSMERYDNKYMIDQIQFGGKKVYAEKNSNPEISIRKGSFTNLFHERGVFHYRDEYVKSNLINAKKPKLARDAMLRLFKCIYSMWILATFNRRDNQKGTWEGYTDKIAKAIDAMEDAKIPEVAFNNGKELCIYEKIKLTVKQAKAMITSGGDCGSQIKALWTFGLKLRS